MKGKWTARLFTDNLRHTLLPFIHQVYPDGHRLQQDNDPKHTFRYAREFFEDVGINWWPTPPESPDLNPIENLWHELKEYIRREIKPTTKQELINGISKFWGTVDRAKCAEYIGHLRKVFPKVVETGGAATGY